MFVQLASKNKYLIMSKEKPIHILHVVGGMNRGGIETWLMHILRHLDRDRFQMDFLVHTTQPCAYDDEIRALGSKIILCLHPSRPWSYAHNFKRILRESGPYDIIHSHVHHFSGYVLCLAQQAGVPVRIAHSHMDTSLVEAKEGFYRHLYLTLMKSWIAHYATVGLGASRKAVANLFSPVWKTDLRWRVFYCGIDLAPFQDVLDSVTVRAELGIPADAFVIGHVGRFEAQKNHLFLVEIAAEVAKQEPKMSLLLVGDGSLLPEIKCQVVQTNLSDRVIFASLRPDVPRMMLGAMDLFVLPSLHEGLPIVGIEAQAAGLPFILSDVISEELDKVKPLLRRLSLSQSASAWAETILNLKKTGSGITQAEALMMVKQSPFNIRTGIKELEKLYLEQSQLSLQHKP